MLPKEIEKEKLEQQAENVTMGTEQSYLGEAQTYVPGTIEATAKHIMFGVALTVDSKYESEWLKEVVGRTRGRLKRMPRYCG